MGRCTGARSIVGVIGQCGLGDPEGQGQDPGQDQIRFNGSGSEYRGEGSHIQATDSIHPDLQKVNSRQHCFKQGGLSTIRLLRVLGQQLIKTG